MHVSHLTASNPQTAALKAKEAQLASPANPAAATLPPANFSQASSATQLPAFEDTNISDPASARQSLDLANGNILGNSNTALAAQANLNPETVLQLLAD